MTRHPRTWFVLKSVLATEALMFVSMAAGEIFVDPNLFSGFLKHPSLWCGIFIETGIAALPVSLIGLVVLEFFRKSSRQMFAVASMATWIVLGVVLVTLYRIFYWTRPWHITVLAPGVLFGWIIPGFLTLACYLAFSLKFYESLKDIGRQLRRPTRSLR